MKADLHPFMEKMVEPMYVQVFGSVYIYICLFVIISFLNPILLKSLKIEKQDKIVLKVSRGASCRTMWHPANF